MTALYSKLAEVTAELGYVARDGKNDFQNYKYTTAEALLAAVRGPLSQRSVVLMPSLTAISEREYTTSKGKASIITTAHVSFIMVDGETGESHKSEWAGQGDDPADKGLGKAFTNAIKTFLREQFLIPQGDDPEADSRTDERALDRAPARSVPAPAPRPQSQTLDDATLNMIRRLYVETRWSPDQLRTHLTAVGAPDVSNVRVAMCSLSERQASELLGLMGSVVDEANAA